MPPAGYYRFPAIHGENVVFVSEDDLWSVSASGGIARRLTANLGAISHPFFSPDGAWLAFTSREEGPSEIYVMPSDGGPIQRVTYLGADSSVVGWTPDGTRILFSTNAARPFRVGFIYAVGPEGGLPEPWPVGPAVSISITTGNRTVIGRHSNDPARWKRYRGGTAGDIWVDAEGAGFFQPLRISGNLARPMWIGERIFFLSDHESIGNLYSCLPDGEDLQRHTHRADYFARYPNSDGRRIVYHAGADLYLYDPSAGSDRKIEVEYHSPRVQRQRRFVETARFLEDYAPHPQGYSAALNIRGKSFTLGNWEGAVTPQGAANTADREPRRYRLTRWLADGKRVVALSDRGGVESLEIHASAGIEDPVRLSGLDIGRPYSLAASPTADQVVLANHRHDLIFVDLEARTSQVIDHSEFSPIAGFDWSPDGRWVAYGLSETQYTTSIRLWDRETGAIHSVTEPVLHDYGPVFDPEGKYLYFIGQRDLNPVYDALQFNLGFPRGSRPFLITLQKELASPFVPSPRPLSARPESKEKESANGTGESRDSTEIQDEAPSKDGAAAPVRIDLEGIARRVVGFPVPEGLYRQVGALKGKALFTSFAIEGALGQNWASGEPPAKGTLEVFNFETQKQETLLSGISDFKLSLDRKTLFYRAARKLRAIKAGEKPDEKASAEPPGRRSGWIDLGRVRVLVEPEVEWRQMAHEAWRLQREFFWTPNMSGIQWESVWDRYSPLIERVNSRGEFSDLMWEMQGELGTSHAYEMGGDYRPEPSYSQGFLGADYSYDDSAGAYRITRIVRGAPGDPTACSPLEAPGVNVQPGDILRAINGAALTGEMVPQELLLNQADVEVTLTVEDSQGQVREVTVKTLKGEMPARYREWVEANRQRVHEESGGRLGYVHIPNMGAQGFAEFHRLYLTENRFDGLIVDVRYNGGGHVSQLLIEKLTRKPLAYTVERWGKPTPYPDYAVAGPLVALTNQWAGSDGDIFSHVFKLLKLGPLLGKRTWGGVIGISPRNPLVDGSITTQPEYSFWFQDVGWGVENYGTDPDIEVDIAPQDWAEGRDPQIEQAIATGLQRLAESPVVRPSFEDRPDLAPRHLIVAPE